MHPKPHLIYFVPPSYRSDICIIPHKLLIKRYSLHQWNINWLCINIIGYNNLEIIESLCFCSEQHRVKRSLVIFTKNRCDKPRGRCLCFVWWSFAQRTVVLNQSHGCVQSPVDFSWSGSSLTCCGWMSPAAVSTAVLPPSSLSSLLFASKPFSHHLLCRGTNLTGLLRLKITAPIF